MPLRSDYYVYAYYEKDSAVPFYIGKGCGRRAWDHLQLSKVKAETPFYKKLQSLGELPDIQILSDDLSEEESFAVERELILQHKRIPDGPLLNLTDGGDGVSGHIHSEETCKKIREARAKQAPLTQEARDTAAERMKGNQFSLGVEHTFEQRIAKSERQVGNPGFQGTHTEDAKQKISEASSKLWASGAMDHIRKPVIAKLNGIVVKRFKSIKEATSNGYNGIGAVCRGLRKRAYGFDWEFEQ